jgi:hypothetical protein
MFYHGMGFGPHMGIFWGGPSFIIMFLLFIFLLSVVRRGFYGGYRGYRGYRRYQRPPYRPYDANPYQGNQPQGSQANPEAPRNETGYYGYGDAANQDGAGVKTVRTGTGAESSAASETGTPTTRVDHAPGGSGEPTRPLR